MSEMIDKLAWAPVQNRSLLFARTKGQELFYNCGGKREPGESDEQALVREVKEEAGVALVPDTIKHVHAFTGPAHGKGEGALMQMTCYDGDYVGEITPTSEIEEFAWFTSADMHRTTLMGRTILQWFIEQNLID